MNLLEPMDAVARETRTSPYDAQITLITSRNISARWKNCLTAYLNLSISKHHPSWNKKHDTPAECAGLYIITKNIYPQAVIFYHKLSLYAMPYTVV